MDKALNTNATPLYVASQNGHSDLACFLVDSLADVHHETTDGATALFIASQMGHYGIVDMLLCANSLIDTPNRSGATALFIAAQQLGLFNTPSCNCVGDFKGLSYKHYHRMLEEL